VRIGVLHPGEMGVSIAQALQDSGHDVGWAAIGRSVETQARAQPFSAFETLSELANWAQGVVAICPPDAAVTQAQQVMDADFRGIYVDANAVSPATAHRIAELVGDNYVDGGVIGPPALKWGTTRLYVSGKQAGSVVGWFQRGHLEVVDMGATPTGASALKMAYAAYTKGSSALLLAVNALAAASGVEQTLHEEWAISQPDLTARSERTAQGTSRKAWRFVGEMQEIAATFEHFGLPGEFHAGAAELYQRMAKLKDLPPATLEQVINQLLK
jgi:3-hydroxyisobutyrate dehydrogenase-like beta-hydroxyacid dehydrogenase